MKPEPTQIRKPADAASYGARVYRTNNRQSRSKQTFKRAMCIAIAFVGVHSSLMAQGWIPDESDAEGAKIAQTAQFKEFIDKYIAAVNAKDRKALRALYDPVSQAAMAKDEKDVKETLDAAVKTKISAEHKVTVSTIGPKNPPMFDDSLYAVRPTAAADIYYSTRPGTGFNSDTMLELATAGGKWYEVWCKPPEEKEVKAALQEMQREHDDGLQKERQKEKAVKVSGVTDYQYEPHPKDKETQTYTWEVRLTAEDSKKDKYEIVQIDQLEGCPAKTQHLVPYQTLKPSHDGFLGFKLGIGDKTNTVPTTGKLQVPLDLRGLSAGEIEAGTNIQSLGLMTHINLSGTTLGEVTPTEKGAALVEGTLRLIRFNTTDEKGAKFVTDVVLRPAKK